MCSVCVCTCVVRVCVCMRVCITARMHVCTCVVVFLKLPFQLMYMVKNNTLCMLANHSYD